MTTALRDDYDVPGLRAEARKTKNAGQARRLLALAAVYDGSSRTEAAEIGGVTLQIVREWVLKFNARGPDGLIDGKAPGKPSRLNDAQRALVAIVERGPIPAIHEVVRWRLIDLCQMGLGGVPRRDLQADHEPRTPGHEVPETVGSTAPSCSSARRDRGF
jgi:transposase